MEIDAFEKIVAAAIEELPQNIKDSLENVAIVIESGRRRDLLGLFEGIPENEWGKQETIRLPDKITIFKDSIERQAVGERQIKDLIKLVVRHEIAHYFGFDEPAARKLEKKWR